MPPARSAMDPPALRRHPWNPPAAVTARSPPDCTSASQISYINSLATILGMSPSSLTSSCSLPPIGTAVGDTCSNEIHEEGAQTYILRCSPG